MEGIMFGFESRRRYLSGLDRSVEGLSFAYEP